MRGFARTPRSTPVFIGTSRAHPPKPRSSGVTMLVVAHGPAELVGHHSNAQVGSRIKTYTMLLV